jgi:UDP-glucose 4-epimerase
LEEKTMRVLITGSSGQIGTNLALKLLEEGHYVFGVDKRINAWTDRFRYILQDLAGNFAHFAGGIGGVEYPEVDVVVHLAANAKVHQLVAEPHRAMENIQITYNILEYCRQTKVPIIFSSSREVYGDIRRYITEEGQADFYFTESTYSASKISGEALIYSYARCYNLPYIVFRFSNVYGRYDNDLDRMERVIPLFIRKIALGEPITVYGRDKVLDFTYVKDCVHGIHLGIEKLLSGEVHNETINLAYGKGNSLLKLVELISAALGTIPEVRIEPSQVGEVTHYVADITRARELLGYEPQVPLEEGIPLTVEWAMKWWREHGRLPLGV